MVDRCDFAEDRDYMILVDLHRLPSQIQATYKAIRRVYVEKELMDSILSFSSL